MPKKYKYTTSFTFEGKRYYVRADTKAELFSKKALKLRDLQEGKIGVSKNMTVSAWADTCIKTYKTNQKEVTRYAYISRVNHCILEHIGDMQISKVKPIECQNVMNLQAGNSRTQVNEVYQALKFLFSHALENGLVTNDPTKYLSKPQYKASNHRRALTHEERSLVEKTGATDPRYYLFLLMLYCGCRPSEAAECMGKDIQQVNGYNMLHIRGTKTANADRFVPIPDKLYILIQNTPENAYISPVPDGRKQQKSHRQRSWNAFKRALNIEMGCKVYRNALVPPLPLADDLVPYCFRHEFCTDLARKGIDIRQAQQLMGHSSINLTANIYTNLTKTDATSVADLLDATPNKV